MSYLNRSGVSLNSINYVDALANSNQILERTGTGRNNIVWNDPPSSIPSGLNATPSQVLSGYKFVGSAGTLQTGTIPTQGGSTITPGTSNKTAVSAGRYVSGNIIVAGDGDLIASNIRYGKNIFNVNGNIREYKQWTGQATTNSSRKSYKVNGGGTVSMYYLTINPTYAAELQLIDGLVLAEEEYGIAARKNAKSTIYKVNNALVELKKTGELDEIARVYGLQSELLVNADTAIGSEPTDSDWSNILSRGKIKIGYTVFAPIAYTDTDNVFKGFDIDLAKAVGEYYGIEVEFVEIQWDSKTMELESGNIDLIWNGMTITDEIKAACEISIPYLRNSQVAVIRKADADKYTSDTSTMSDAVIAAESGSAGQAVVEK